MLRIGRIPYINTEPFFNMGSYGSSVFVYGAPRELTGKALQGEVDAATFSLVDAWKLENDFEFLEPWGVATNASSGSVFLFSSRPIPELGGCRIGVTNDSSTSLELARVILRHRYNVQPGEIRRGLSSADDAQLLIGDDAIRVRQRIGESKKIHAIDLATEWNNWQGLPFVFSVWMVRRSVSETEKNNLRSAIDMALTKSLQNLQIVADDVVKRTGFKRQTIHDYFKGFNYRFGKPEIKAMEVFRALCGMR